MLSCLEADEYQKWDMLCLNPAVLFFKWSFQKLSIIRENQLGTFCLKLIKKHYLIIAKMAFLNAILFFTC